MANRERGASRSLRVALATVTVMAFVAALIAAIPGAANAANNQFLGSVDALGDKRDGWEFSVTQPGTIAVDLDWDDAAADLSLFLKGPTGAIVASVTQGSEKPKSIVFGATDLGTWKVEVKAKSGAANYTIDVEHSVASGSTTTFDFSGNATKWRKHTFDATQGSTIDVVLDWDDDTAALNLYMRSATGVMVVREVDVNDKPKSASFVADATGTWLVATKPKVGSSTYTMDVTVSGDGPPPTMPPPPTSTPHPTPTSGPTPTPGPAGSPIYVRTIGFPGGAEIAPSGLDVDPAGNVYVAGTGNDRIKAYAADGSLLWVSGTSGPKALGRFDNPRDVAYLDGKVYVADTGYKRVQVLDAATGAALMEFPNTILSPMGVTAGVDANGDDVVLVAQGRDSRIEMYTPTGTLIQTVGGPGTGDGEFLRSRDAATDSDGNIYVVDYIGHRVVKYAPDGTWIMNWGSLGTGVNQFRRPYGIAIDDQDLLYIADNSNERIVKYDTEGNYIEQYAGPGDGPGEFDRLRRVAVGSGSSPQVYGAGLWSFKVERFAQNGDHERTFGGVLPIPGGFNEPYGVAVTSAGTYVVDTSSHRVQRFSPAGIFELTWGVRGDDEEDHLGFDWPRDITVDDDGNLWVADTKNHRLIKYDSNGVPVGLSYAARGSGMGQIDRPHGIAAYGTDLIIADTLNDRVQRWDASGIVPQVVWVYPDGANPKDVAVFGDSVYVADTDNKRIVELDIADGSFIREIGSGVLNSVEGVAVEPGGEIWVADTSASRLVHFAADGTVIQTYASFGSAHGRLNGPGHLEILEDAGTLYLFVVDTGNDRVEVFDIGPATATAATVAPTAPTTATTTATPLPTPTPTG